MGWARKADRMSARFPTMADFTGQRIGRCGAREGLLPLPAGEQSTAAGESKSVNVGAPPDPPSSRQDRAGHLRAASSGARGRRGARVADPGNAETPGLRRSQHLRTRVRYPFRIPTQFR